MRFFTLLIFFFLVLVAKAQEVVIEDRYNEIFGPKPAFVYTVRSSFNADDVNIGLELGRTNAKRNFLYAFSFDARPFRRPLLVYQGGALYYQLREERYFVGGAAQYNRSFSEKKIGAFAQMGVNYTWGNYGGSDQKPPKGWVLVPRMGLSYKITERSILKLGYAYIDTKTSALDNHRIFLSYSFIGSR
jgi:hypothetical protein